MSKTTNLRVADCRAIFRLVGECRELGDDWAIWRLHFLERLARLIDADRAQCAEVARQRNEKIKGLETVSWGHENWMKPGVRNEIGSRALQDDWCSKGGRLDLGSMAEANGTWLSGRGLIEDWPWSCSPNSQILRCSRGLGHLLYCFGAIPNGSGDEYSGLRMLRSSGRGDFRGRDCVIVHEAHAAVTPLIGGPLARLSEPSPSDLAPRVRQVLRCLLEGNADKQVAARLGLSAFTVNQYTKAIFRHFGVCGRADLLSRWIRRGWGGPFAWDSTDVVGNQGEG